MSEARSHAVIMAGGRGTRFWPLSRNTRPKQFLPIVGDDSMLRQTFDRSSRLLGGPDHVVVVTSRDYADLTREQLPELAPENLLIEPQARNTAPCLAWAAAELEARDPGSTMLVFPADHVIADVEALGAATTAAREAAASGQLVTFGILPRYPETGYGYVEVDAGATLVEHDGVTVHPVSAFREKPDADTARRYVAAGNFFWNSGMFVWRSQALLDAFEQHLPEGLAGARQMLAAGSEAEREAAYARMPATSIDYGIMEKASNVACVRAGFDWSDVGSWAALHELLDGDEDGNVTRGRVVTVDAQDNLVEAPDEVVALLGVERLAVVRAGGVLLVASLERSQDIKQLRARLAELDREDLL